MANPSIGRRTWIASGLVAAAAVPLGAWYLMDDEPRFRSSRFGRIQRDPEGVLDLLEGFSYRILQRVDDPMSDGYPVPSRPDGMACFDADDGTYVLMRNHELPKHARMVITPTPDVPEKYDAVADGGVTRVVLSASDLEVRSSNLVLAGTTMNCSGGASPWGWLSCEEDADERNHGYVFLCDPSADRVQPAVRIDGYGRFQHEAAAVRLDDAVCYLTEDSTTGCFYRFTPDDPNDPFEGTLSAMALRGQRSGDTSGFRRGESHEIEWIEVADPTPREDDLRATSRQRGACLVKRGEGVAVAEDGIYVTATTGGPIDGGQIFRIHDAGETGTLEVVASSTNLDVLDMPDNICVAGDGTLFFVEDGRDHDFLRCVDRRGTIVDIGYNAASIGEITGVCMTPDSRAMFVNLQDDGLTVLIEGPFDQFAGA